VLVRVRVCVCACARARARACALPRTNARAAAHECVHECAHVFATAGRGQDPDLPEYLLQIAAGLRDGTVSSVGKGFIEDWGKSLATGRTVVGGMTRALLNEIANAGGGVAAASVLVQNLGPPVSKANIRSHANPNVGSVSGHDIIVPLGPPTDAQKAQVAEQLR